MARDLKKSTAVVVVVGPFVDSAGAAVTAPTIASIDITAYKNDGTPVTITPAASGSSNDMVHVDDGYYSLELTTTDTNTVGYLRLTFQISGALIFQEDFTVLAADAYDRKHYGREPRTWYLDSAAAGAANGFNRTDAFTTWAAVLAVAVAGDTIRATGSFSGAVSITTPGLTIIGSSMAGLTLTHSSGSTLTVAHNTTLENMTVTGTHATTGVGVDASSKSHVTLRSVRSVGTFDGFQADLSYRFEAYGCQFVGTYDGGNLANAQLFYFEGCKFSTDCTYASVDWRGVAAGTAATDPLTDLTQGEFVNCTFDATKADATTANYVAAVEISGCIEFRNCELIAWQLHASTNQPAYGFKENTGADGSAITVKGCIISPYNVGTGTEIPSRMVGASSKLWVDSETEYSVDHTPDANVGNVIDATPTADESAAAVRTNLTTELGRIDAAVTSRLAPTVAARTLDISSNGNAGIDWANIDSPTSTVNMSGLTISSSQQVASVNGVVPLDAAGTRSAIGLGSANLDTQLADLPTTAEQAVADGQILSAVGAVSTQVGTPVGASIADDIADAKADTAAILVDTGTTLPAAIDGIEGGGTVTADRVPKQLTFYIGSEGNTSRNIVTLNDWSSGTRTLAFDLSELLNQSDTTISTVDTVTVVKGVTSITTSNLRKHQNQKIALWDTAAISSANTGTYVVTVTITTADSNTIVLTGTLEVE